MTPCDRRLQLPGSCRNDTTAASALRRLARRSDEEARCDEPETPIARGLSERARVAAVDIHAEAACRLSVVGSSVCRLPSGPWESHPPRPLCKNGLNPS